MQHLNLAHVGPPPPLTSHTFKIFGLLLLDRKMFTTSAVNNTLFLCYVLKSHTSSTAIIGNRDIIADIIHYCN